MSAWLDVLLAGAGGMSPALALVVGGVGGAGGAGVLLASLCSRLVLIFLLEGNV